MVGGGRKKNQHVNQVAAHEEIMQQEWDRMLEFEDLKRQVRDLTVHLTQLEIWDARFEAEPDDHRSNGEFSDFKNSFHGSIC